MKFNGLESFTLKVLIIENDPATNQALSAALTGHRFEIHSAGDGQAGLAAARAGPFDLLLLDVVLPHLDGFSLLRTLRQGGDQTPVIFLTARDGVEDRIRGLELGADDYITKPFSPGELVARVKTVLRRTSERARANEPIQGPEQLISIGDLEMDMTRRRAFRAGRRLSLTPKEFSLLSLLARRRGQALTRALIAEEIWETRIERDTNVVDVHVRRLRSKLDDPFDRKLLVTVRGVGYMLSDGASAPAEPL